MKKNIYFFYWLIRTLPMRWNFPKFHILSFEETVNQIIKHKKNISRFGDGEFRLLIGERDIVFQKLNDKISQRLREVLNSDLENHIVAIPSSFSTINNLKRDDIIHWLNFINLYGKSIVSHINNPKKQFGDAFVSRFYLSYKKKNKMFEKVKMLKKIWQNKDVLFVEGEFSRLGIGNNLFDNAKSIQRIICPSNNAFEKYDEILAVTKKFGHNKLIIVALGPAATILAYDLAKEKFWALDLGHIDIEYSWFLQKAIEKVPVRGKKSAEICSNENFELSEFEKRLYENSIIVRIL